ncbi:MAG: hypothetical protein R6X12_09615 [bacterium]
MLRTTSIWILLALAGGLLVVGGMVTSRAVAVAGDGLRPTIESEEAVGIYQDRMQATYEMLDCERPADPGRADI